MLGSTNRDLYLLIETGRCGLNQPAMRQSLATQDEIGAIQRIQILSELLQSRQYHRDGVPMAWYEWHQSDLPCEFSVDRARENLEYLERALGQKFVATRWDARQTHPLLNEWNTTGAGAFLQLNSMAEDLRLLEGKAGLAPVLNDLRDERQCLPTWHLLHTAALFERARPSSVLEFVTADGDEAPDLVVGIDGDRVPVEAKLLTQSEDELRFVAVARRIQQALVDDGPAVPVQTAVYVILKQPVTTDISGEVIKAALEVVACYGQTAVCERRSFCNIFLEPAQLVPGLSEYRIVYVFAPVPDSENMRVLARAKKASNQLRSLPSAVDSGILSVGLTDNHDGASAWCFDGTRGESLGGFAAFTRHQGSYCGSNRMRA
jgi:hypothetical protein